MSARPEQPPRRLATRLFGYAVIQLSLVFTLGDAVADSGPHRGWVVAGAVLTELLLVGAVVEAVRRRERPSRRRRED